MLLFSGVNAYPASSLKSEFEHGEESLKHLMKVKTLQRKVLEILANVMQ